jgi:urease accessory protein
MAGAAVLALPLLLAAPASAHHAMGALGLAEATPLTGLISGLAHPVLGPDHLLFLVALGLVGLQRRGAWMLALLAVGLGASALGLVLPGLPGSELLVALSLVAAALVLLQRLPALVLLPAFALHGYVLSASVLGWESTPIAFYFLGLLLSQSLLLAGSLCLVRRWASHLSTANLRLVAGLLMGVGAAFAWTSLVA